MSISECFESSQGERLSRIIEMETVLPLDGRLPSGFRKAIGRRAKVVVSYNERENTSSPTEDSHSLMELSGKILAFQHIQDPVAFQREMRDEWTRNWEK